MKKLSVRLRITLLYTFFMTVLTAASLFLLFSLSSREVLTSAGAELEEEVHESVEELTIQNGEVRVDSDFYSLEKGVYLALYDEQGYFLYGRVPYGFDVQPEFEDGNLRKLNDRQKKWFVYDQFFKVDGENSVYVRGVTSITDVEEKLINCDKYEIERCIINLVGNAVKFTPEGGLIEVLLQDLDDKVKIIVKDNGIGISEENQKIIFDRFNQVVDKSAELKGGSGLGLTISKQLITLHGGDIYVESEVGVGSEFIIILPVYSS